MQDFRDIYDAPAEVDEEFEVEAELADPGQRILAYLINQLITILLIVPFILIGVMSAKKSSDNIILFAGIGGLLLLIYGIYQIVIMSKDGQSLGKKIMKIKVVNEEGENPGFVGTVLVREIAFNVILSILGLVPFVGSFIGLIVWFVMLVMLFSVSKDRRTFQDMLAKTYVVKT